jgi:hypothetical protein
MLIWVTAGRVDRQLHLDGVVGGALDESGTLFGADDVVWR